MFYCGIPIIDKGFQLGHFLAEMDRQRLQNMPELPRVFQLGHFLAEMDSYQRNGGRRLLYVSIGPLLSRNG